MPRRGISKPKKNPRKKSTLKLDFLKGNLKKPWVSKRNSLFFENVPNHAINQIFHILSAVPLFFPTVPDNAIEHTLRFLSQKPKHADWAVLCAAQDRTEPITIIGFSVPCFQEAVSLVVRQLTEFCCRRYFSLLKKQSSTQPASSSVVYSSLTAPLPRQSLPSCTSFFFVCSVLSSGLGVCGRSWASGFVG